MPIIGVGHIRLYYQREGKGPTVIFIAGMGDDHGLWTQVVKRLKNQYDCITFDNRGIGQSSKPRSGYTIAQMANDTMGLLEKLSIPQAHVVGLAIGGMVAQILVLERPDLVKGLILINTMAAPDPRFEHILESRKNMQKSMELHEYFSALADWLWGIKAFAKPGFINSWVKAEAESPNRQPFHAAHEMIDSMCKLDTRSQLKKIRKPTLVMWGEEDIAMPLHMSRAISQGIPGAKLMVVPEVGHLCTHEDPKEMADRIASFLKRVDSMTY